MIQVLLEVRAGAARFRVSAQATSIQRAVSLAGARYPGGDVRLVFPLEPETFFVERAACETESLAVRLPESAVG